MTHGERRKTGDSGGWGPRARDKQRDQFAELDLGRGVKKQLVERLEELGVRTTVVSKDIGYELRCADPIPFDIEYTRDLG